MTLVLNNAKVFRSGVFSRSSVSISLGNGVSRGGTISTMDASSFVILPGFVDVHVHLREPGFSYKETIRTGSLAAAHGGYTTVCAMPNLNPVPDSLEHLWPELDAIARDGRVRVYPYGAITRGEKGAELADMPAMEPFVCGFSDDGRGVKTAETMREAMQKCKAADSIIAAHCEDMSWIPAGGAVHDGAFAKAHGIPGIPSESEWKPIERDIALCCETGCRYHVCHVSTKESVALIRQAKAEGVNITCETGPHYLLLCQDDLQDLGRFKMNPPLRNKDDQEALLAGLLDGTIDMIATDHAPHSAEEKAKGLRGSAMGVVGIETAFPLLYTYLVETGKMPLEMLIDRMADAPRRRFRIDGGMQVGDKAAVTVFDLHAQEKIDPNTFLSKGRATPFEGWEVHAVCRLTVCGDKIAYNALSRKE